MKKRTPITLLLTLLIIFTTAWPVLAKQEPIKIVVNGKIVKTDVDPFISNNRTYVPARFVTEAFGGEVIYSKDEKGNAYVLICPKDNGDTCLSLHIGKKRAQESEAIFKFDVPPIIKNNRTMIPVRFIASYLGCNVDWDKDTRTVILTSTGSNEAFYDTYYDKVGSQKLLDWLMSGNPTMEAHEKIFD